MYKIIEGGEKRVSEVECMIVNELVRTEDILTRKIEKVDNKLEEIDKYYRIEKLEKGNVELNLQRLEN